MSRTTINDRNFDPYQAAARRRWAALNAAVVLGGVAFMLATRYYVLPMLETEQELQRIAYIVRHLSTASLFLLSSMFAVLLWQTISLSVKLREDDRDRRRLTEEFLQAQERAGYVINPQLRDFFLNEIDVRDARRRSWDDPIVLPQEGKSM